MTAAVCSRRWEAEALHDGRLDGADRASFERHVGSCAACHDELSALRALDAAMGALGAEDAPPLERHRLRAALLREANDRIVASPRANFSRWVPLAAVLVVTLAFAALWITRTRAVVPVASNVATAPKFDVASIDGAVWRIRTDGATATIELVEGSASFAVPHLEPAQRFVVALPDAEIEVRGTRFDVAVEAGATRSVSVTEGRVVLRRRGGDELALRAGDRWSRVEPSPPIEVVASTPPPVASAAPRKAHPSPIASTVASSAPSAASRFEGAMAAFHAADYARADSLLATFAVDFPSDPRCEDAAFLRAVACWRLGDKSGAAKHAKAYLDAYPNGLRRVEARRMIDARDALP